MKEQKRTPEMDVHLFLWYFETEKEHASLIEHYFLSIDIEFFLKFKNRVQRLDRGSISEFSLTCLVQETNLKYRTREIDFT